MNPDQPRPNKDQQRLTKNKQEKPKKPENSRLTRKKTILTKINQNQP